MSLAPDQLRALELLRDRLAALSQTLANTDRDLRSRDPLPQWPQMESIQSVLGLSLGQLKETMSQFATIYKEAHIYPTSNFPGHREGDMLTALLRKKLDVQGEAWIKEFTEDYRGDDAGLSREEYEGLWGWASGASQGIVGPMVENEAFADDFTLAETEEGVENVRTGLRRKLWEEESGDEDDEGDKMEEDVMPERKGVEEGVDVDAKPLPLEDVLRFATTGALPARPNR